MTVGVLVFVGVIVGVLVGVIVLVGVTVLVGVLLGVGGIVGQVNSNWNVPPTVSVVTCTTTIVGSFNVFVKLFSDNPVNVVELITLVEFHVTKTLLLTFVVQIILIKPVFNPTLYV